MHDHTESVKVPHKSDHPAHAECDKLLYAPVAKDLDVDLAFKDECQGPFHDESQHDDADKHFACLLPVNSEEVWIHFWRSLAYTDICLKYRTEKQRKTLF